MGATVQGGMLWATNHDIALCCTCQVLLVPHPSKAGLGWAAAGLRYLVSSLALLLMFMKPSVCGCLSFPSRIGAADPGPLCR